MDTVWKSFRDSIYLLNGSLTLAVFEFPVLLLDNILLTYQARGISNALYH